MKRNNTRENPLVKRDPKVKDNMEVVEEDAEDEDDDYSERGDRDSIEDPSGVCGSGAINIEHTDTAAPRTTASTALGVTRHLRAHVGLREAPVPEDPLTASQRNGSPCWWEQHQAPGCSSTEQQDGEPVQSARTTPSGNNAQKAVLGALAGLGVNWHKDDIPGLPQILGELALDVRETTDDQDDPEFQELLREASDDHLQPQPSMRDYPDELESLVLDLEAVISPTGLLAQTTAEAREASESQQERLRRLCMLDALGSNLFTGPCFRTIPEDVYLCIICRREETFVRILDCGHCHWCLDCFKKYVQQVRPPRCPVCKRRSKSYDFR